MPGSFVTPLDVAAQVDRVLRRNIQWPLNNKVFADSPVTVTDLDRATMCDASGGNMAVNLPDATLNKGMDFIVKKTDPGINTVTIACTVGGQTIDGAGAKILIAQNDFIVVESDGSNYKIIALLISSATTGGAVFYTVKKVYKTDGVSTLVPVDGTTIPFTVAVDGECFFSANGVFGGSTGLDSVYLAIYVDGVLLCNSQYFTINGSGGDRTGPVTQSPNGSKFLAAGPHTVELVAAQVNLALQASVADPLTLSVLYPAASFNTAAPTPKAATLVVHPVPGVGDFTNIESALAAITALGGGYILVREGTYTPPAGGYIMPDVPVVIRGCGDATIIDAAGAADPFFSFGFVHNYVIEDLTVTGTAVDVNRRLVSASVAADITVMRVHGTFLRTVLEVTGGAATVFHMTDSSFDLFLNAASWFLDVGFSAIVHAYNVSVTGQAGTAPIGPPTGPAVFLYDCSINSVNGVDFGTCVIDGCTFTGTVGQLVKLKGTPKVSDCHFVGVTLEIDSGFGSVKGCVFETVGAQVRYISLPTGNGNGTAIVGCTFFGGVTTEAINVDSSGCIISACDLGNAAQTRAVDITATGVGTIIEGCTLINGTSEAVRNAASGVEVKNCVNSATIRPTVTETGAADNNRYNDISFSSTILGAATIINEWNTRDVAATLTLDETHRTVLVDATGGAVVVNLPTAASAKYRKYSVKKVDVSANTVTIDPSGAETIDGAATKILSSQYQTITFQSNGTTWEILVPLPGGSSTLSVRAVAVNDNILSTDDVILATAGAGGITLTLPNPATNPGHIFRVKKVDAAAGSVTIAPFAAETIDGAASFLVVTQYQSISLISDGVNWYIV